MATIYGVNYTKNYVNVPSSKAAVGDVGGRLRVLYDEYTLLADSTSGDILKIGQLPIGARVMNARLSSTDMGGTGTIGLGWAASADAVEAASAAGFISAADNSGQALLAQCVAGAAGLGKDFAAAVDVQAVLGTSSGATGGVIKVWIEYVVA